MLLRRGERGGSIIAATPPWVKPRGTACLLYLAGQSAVASKARTASVGLPGPKGVIETVTLRWPSTVTKDQFE